MQDLRRSLFRNRLSNELHPFRTNLREFMAIVVHISTKPMDSLEFTILNYIFIRAANLHRLGLVFLIVYNRTFVSALDQSSLVHASKMTSVQLHFNNREFVHAHFL